MTIINRGVAEQYLLRKLEELDFEKDAMYLSMPSCALCIVLKRTLAVAERFSEIGSHPLYTLLVIEDTFTGQIVAAGTLLVELKFIHGCSSVGHVEDVVVDAACRGLKLGQRIVAALVDAAQAGGCYKAILDSAQGNTDFYIKSGFNCKEVQMVYYF